MQGQRINVGGIYADLEIDSTHLDRGLANGRKAMDAFGEEIKRLQAGLQAGAITQQDYNVRINRLTIETAKMAAAMRDAYTANQQLNVGLNIYNAGVGNATSGSNRFANSLVQVSYLMDDMQYSILATVNNIGPMVYAMSGSAGLAGSMQIAAVAGNVLIQHWDQFLHMLGLDPILTEAEHLEKLAHKTHLTAEETRELNKAKKEQHELDRLLDGSSKEENAHGKAIKEDLAADGGARKTRDAMLPLMGHKMGEFRRKQILEEERGFQASDLLPTLPGQAAAKAAEREKAARKRANVRINKEIKDMDERDANELLTGASQGDPKAIRDLKKLVEKFPNRFPPGFLKDLEDALPENSKQQKEWETEGAANAKKFDINEKKLKKDEAKRKRDLHNNTHDKQAFERDNLELAKTLTPGFDKMATDAAAGAGTRDEAVDAMAGLLVNQGMTPDDARDAAKASAGKEFDRFRDDPNAARAHRLGEKARTKGDAGEAISGIGEIAEGMVGKAFLSGTPMDMVGKQLTNMLMGQGMNEGDAGLATSQLMKDAKKATLKKALERPQMDGPETNQRRSEVYNTSELTERIQSSIGGQSDEAKKQTEYQKKMEEWLHQMANTKAIMIEVS